jgi:CheY-like chemotaxis protein
LPESLVDVTENNQNAILIVDDNLNNLQLLFAHLRHAEFKVLLADNGRLALEHAEKAHPDLILLDVMMPGIDGFETCRQLKQNVSTCDIPVVFMTAMVDPVDKLTGFNAEGGGLYHQTLSNCRGAGPHQRPPDHSPVAAPLRAIQPAVGAAGSGTHQ